ncbi:hypothetical protein [Alkalilimnicola sp. S0819]|nr:hypothetical protein [Alkalilimnicola sp. S0819]
MRKFIALILFSLPLLLLGCDNEGPMEQAGENLDETAEEAGEVVE